MKDKNRSALRSFFTDNIWYKIAAFMIAVIVWALLSNTEDPVTSKDLYIPVTYLYEEKLLNTEKLCVISSPSTVRITVQARNSNLTRVKADLFSCTADLMSHSGGDLTSQLVHVEVKQNSGYDIVLDWNYYKSDPTVAVSMDEYIEKSFYVNLGITGTLPEGLFLGSTRDFEPGTVTVSGPKSKFGNIASVQATLDLSEIADIGSGFFEKELDLKMYDSNDNVISNSDQVLKLSSETAVLYSVLIRERTLAVRTEGTAGTPADAHRITSVKVEPEILEVNGLDQNFENADEILIPAGVIDVSGISGTTTYRVDVNPYLPEGVTPVGDGIVTVTVDVEAMETASFTFAAGDITLISHERGYDYTVSASSSVTLRVRGYREDLEGISKESFQAVADLTGLTDGRNRVRVEIIQIAGLRYENADSLFVNITKTAHVTEPSETDSSVTETEEVSSSSSEEEASSTVEDTPPESESSSEESDTGSSEDESTENPSSSSEEGGN